MTPILRLRRTILFPGLVIFGVAGVGATEDGPRPKESRAATVARSQVWSPTDVRRMDIERGPKAADGFAPGAIVECEYHEKELSGNSPKFACIIGDDDEVKVKFGGTNGEVYAEVAASRLLWALGFRTDRMYPVKILCRGCPPELEGIGRLDGRRLIDPATIERKAAGEEMGEDGWGWPELDQIDERAGGAPRAHRDALKLLAVLIQHTDSKPQQQRLVCLTPLTDGGACAKPFMMINDLGLTFGRANWANANADSAANLLEWSRVPVWKGETGCVGNLPRSMTGTLHNPVISEAGRRFLASLLVQLSDEQLRDLFEVARFDLRTRDPQRGRSGFPAIQEWVDAFKEKRQQIVDRRC